MKESIVCIGDSITFGYPYGPEYSWVNIGVENNPACPNVINKGVNGDTSRSVAGRFRKDVVKVHPQAVVVTIGTNDALMEISPQEYETNISTYLQMTMEHQIELVLGIPIPALDIFIEGNLDSFRQILKKFSLTHDLPVLDFNRAFKTFSGPIRRLYVDEVHPSIQGYRVMGEVFTRFMNAYYPG